MRHELQIHGLQPTYISPFNTDKIFMECENILGCVGYEEEIVITINGFDHFIYNINMTKPLLIRHIESAVRNNCMRNLFKEANKATEQGNG